MPRPRATLPVTTALLLGASCSLTTDLDGLSGSGSGASVAGAGGGSSSSSASASSTAGPGGAGGGELDGGTDADGGDATPGECGGTAGPAMIHIQSGTSDFCIDATEVTREHYLAFVNAKGADTSGQPAECAWNTTYVPGASWPPVTKDEQQLPAVSLDWCDAFAFCAWAGKRLCGAIQGGPTPFSEPSDAATGQWFHACSHGGDGKHIYPYGEIFDDTACNTAKSTYQATLPVAALPGCEGGYPGIFDISGNVEEWEDSCDAAAGANDHCHRRGGSWKDGDYLKFTSCAETWTPLKLRSDKDGDVGFRCCTP